MFWGPATIFFYPNSNICRDCHLMLWLSKKDLAPKGMKPLRRQVVGQLLHSADCSSPWKVTQSLFLQWNDVNKAHLWFSKSICLCLQKNFKRKKERGEGGREEGKKEERNSLCVFFPTPWKELLKADTLIKYAAACKQWKVSVFVWVELINVVGKPGDVSSPPTLGETPCWG